MGGLRQRTVAVIQYRCENLPITDTEASKGDFVPGLSVKCVFARYAAKIAKIIFKFG